KISDTSGVEVSGKQIWEAFSKTYLEVDRPYKFLRVSTETLHDENDSEHDQIKATLKVEINGEVQELTGLGNGPIDACKDALISAGCPVFKLTDFVEHALISGSDAVAAAYIQIEDQNGHRVYGVGQDPNTTKASIKALLCAV